MKYDKRIISNAKKLVKLALSSGEVLFNERVRSIVLEVKSLHKNAIYKKSLLFLFHKFLLNSISSHSLILEYAGEISDDVVREIVSYVEKSENKKFFLKKYKNEQLIAGVKIVSGDIVLENSVKNDITRL